MSIGLPVTKQEIDTRAGDIARAYQRLAGDVETLLGYLQGTEETVLIEFGYTSGEVAVMKSGITDLEQLIVRIGFGSEALAAPKDFRQFLRHMWGVGAF